MQLFLRIKFRKSRALFVTKVKLPSMMRGMRSQSVSPLNPSQFT